MAGISVGGLGSGLDINSLVQQLVAAEGQPIEQRYQRREVDIQTKLSGLGFLKGAIADFRQSLTGLKNLGNFSTINATSSSTSVFTVSANSTAVPGSYSLEVQQLATQQKLASESFATKDTVVGTGILTFEFGTFDGNFTLNPEKGTKAVDLTSTDGSLAAIRDKVNESDIGVTATIINDGSGFKLVFTSDDTGENNSLRITVDDADTTDTNTSGLSKLAFDPDAGVGNGKNLVQTVAALDAVAVLDGLNVTSDTNELTDLIEGLTIKLKSADVGVDHTISVSKSNNVGGFEVEDFVESYNTLNQTLRDLSKYVPQTGERGILFGDATLRSIQNQVAQSISTSITALDSTFNSLAAIGIKTGEGGSLSVDQTLFNAAVSAEPDIVARLFSNFGKTTDPNVSFVSAQSDTLIGNFAVNISQAATQGLATGNAVANLTINDGVNDQLQISIDGKLLSIDLTAKTYGSTAELAAEIQGKINGNSSLDNTDIGVSVSESGGILTITSNAFGSASTVVVNGGNGAAGLFGTAASTAGLDVEGTIGGQSATGVGQFLSTADGLKLKISSASTGDRGTVNYTKGMSETLDEFLDSFVGSDGVIDVREDILNGQIQRVSDDRQQLFNRLGKLEKRLLDQFTNLDLLLTGFQQTSSFLTGALANLPGSTRIGSRN